MHQLDWITRAIAAEHIHWPGEFETLLATGKRHQPPFYFLHVSGGADETRSMARQFPDRRVIAFARRLDADAVVCVVLSDRTLKRGQVVVVHDDAMAGHEVDEQFASIAEWTKAALEEIDERVREGWNEPIKDLLD